MAFEIVADEEVVQVVISDGVGDVCEHFAMKVHTRDCKGSRLGARGYEHGAAEGAFVRWPIPPCQVGDSAAPSRARFQPAKSPHEEGSGG